MTIQNSINTNVGALVALRNLNTVNRDLEAVQNRVSTGLKVSGARDDASVFSVAQGIRGDLKGYEAVGQALSGGRGILSVAESGATQVSNLLADIRGKLTQLSDEGISQDQRQIYSADLKEQFLSLRSFLEGANYNGRNLISANNGTSVNGENDGRFQLFTQAADAKVIRSVNGEQLTLRAADLLVGDSTAIAATSEIDAFQAFARVVFVTQGGTAAATAADGQNAVDFGAATLTQSSSATAGTVDGGATGSLLAREFIGARIAQAALADLDANGNRATASFRTADTATAGTISVFNSALAFFEQEVAAALGSIGADLRNVDFQINFNTSIADAVEEGLGSLVDADLARESARLQALQTKQQLSVQTLAIANQRPTILLSLFQ
ncbi:MAG: flagellin [Pseudomonadota bacterium]